MTRTLAKLVLAAILALAAPAALAEPLAIVVDRDNPKSDVSTEEIRSIFLGKRTEWPDGTRAVPIDLDPSQASRAAFLGAVVGMTPAQFAYHWVDQGVRGAGSAPKAASTPSAALKAVARIRGAVAFVPVSLVDASVKVVTVNGKKPGDAGYPVAGP
jgi:ABC-type phosphate transport system substrate-binding protein